MDSYDFDFLVQFPLISTEHFEGYSTHCGIISVNGLDWQIQLREIKSPTGSSFKIQNVTDLGHIKTIEDLEKTKHPNIYSYLLSLKDKLDNFKSTEDVDVDCVKFCIQEYVEFTKFYLNLDLCSLDLESSRIKVRTLDDKRRKHYVEINISLTSSSEIFTITQYDLPRRKDGDELFGNSCSLTSLFNEYLGVLDILQPYFDIIEMIDQTCHVLDPQQPEYKHNFRRVSVDNNVSALITVDAYNSFRCPDVKFLGLERFVNQYRDNFASIIENWNSHNLNESVQNIIDMLKKDKKDILMQEIPDALKTDSECGICCCLLLEDKLPDVICPNICCKNVFHISCLYEWFTTINAKRMFNTLHGPCLNCEKNIQLQEKSCICHSISNFVERLVHSRTLFKGDIHFRITNN